MESSQFFFLILPLAICVFALVGVILYTKSRSEEDQYETKLKKLRQMLFAGKLDRRTYINLSRRLRYVKQFNSESSKLVSLLSDEKIDEETFVRLRHVLETTFKQKFDKIDDTPESFNKEPFIASKF